MKNLAAPLIAAALCPGLLFAEIQVTVFNQNLGLVKETREIELRKGVSKIEFAEVPSQIDPTSVRLKLPLDTGKFSVLEQNFEYDLVSRDKLLQKYLGKEIEIERRTGKDGEKKELVRGKLLSTADGLVVQSDDRILLNPAGEISLAKLPDGLVLKPTLSWLIESSAAGTFAADVAYLTSGIGWSADYVLAASKDDRTLDLTGWVTIENRSGAAFKDAKLKLIAGDVNRVQQPRFAGKAMDRVMAFAQEAAAPQFQEKSFFEYHLYTLQRKTTIRDNETKQVEFIKAEGIPASRVYVYDGNQQFRGAYAYQQWARADRNYGAAADKKVAVMLEFKNAAGSRLGMPLPAGKIRLYKEDADRSLEFVGEDTIDHTPKDETVRLTAGNAFDIVGERMQTDFKCGNDWCEESFKITIRNHKDTAVEVKAVEHLYRWSNWKITEKSAAYEKKDSRTIEYRLKVPADGEQSVTYTVRYWW